MNVDQQHRGAMARQGPWRDALDQGDEADGGAERENAADQRPGWHGYLLCEANGIPRRADRHCRLMSHGPDGPVQLNCPDPPGQATPALVTG
jgi:hypothetical protein